MSMPGTSTINDDWSFEMVGVSPGQRSSASAGLSATHAIEGRLGRRQDVIDTATPFDGQEGMVSGVRLVVTDKVTAMTGAVTD